MTAAPAVDRYQDLAAQAQIDGDPLLAGVMHLMIAATLVGREFLIAEWLIEAARMLGKDWAEYEHWVKTG